MALTAYAGQIIVWGAVAAATLGDAGDLDGFRALDPFWPFALGALAACTAWSLLVGRGPLEWVVDRGARGLSRLPRSDAEAARLG
jgi:uncharacterized membrane protein YeiB